MTSWDDGSTFYKNFFARQQMALDAIQEDGLKLLVFNVEEKDDWINIGIQGTIKISQVITNVTFSFKTTFIQV